MAEEIIYQFNTLLADNTVTVDDKEDKILVPVSNGNADTARIIAEMKAEDSGLREETIQHVVALYKRGIIENSQWNPAKNSITVNFQMGAVADR